MATWFVKGDTRIGYHIMPERKKPVFGITKGNVFMGYGQFLDEESAEKFMEELAKFFNIWGTNNES